MDVCTSLGWMHCHKEAFRLEYTHLVINIRVEVHSEAVATPAQPYTRRSAVDLGKKRTVKERVREREQYYNDIVTL